MCIHVMDLPFVVMSIVSAGHPKPLTWSYKLLCIVEMWTRVGARINLLDVKAPQAFVCVLVIFVGAYECD